MEKRTILAFVLSFIILIGWLYLFGSKKEPIDKEREDTTQEDQKTVSAPHRTPSRVSLTPADGHQDDGFQKDTKPPSPIDSTEKEIKVETPLYIATFSNRGPVIKSFRLKKYLLNQRPNAPYIELAHLANNEEDFFNIGFGRQWDERENHSLFDVNEDAILLEPGSSPKDLRFYIERSDGVTIEQTFRFYPDIYPIDITITLSNKTENPADGNIRAYFKNLPPQNKESYYSFHGAALYLNDDLEEIKPKKMKEGKNLSGKIDWMAYERGYFISAIIPKNQDQGNFVGRLLPSGTIEASYITPSVTVDALKRISSQFTLYMGPRDVDMLKQAGEKLDHAVNFGFFDIIAKPLHSALRFFYRYVHNYGVSIIILTIIIKILFWPLTHKSYKSMKEMQKLQPLMAKIREKYKNNREQMQRELMGLYKTYKINPMGGCLPMIIQIPVFFALFRILGNSIELRHAPFILWITDLSAPDRLFYFSFNIPFMSPPSGIPVLTLLMGASMFIQQKLTPTPGDPAQAKIMMFLPIIFTVMFINFPSGLVLYWLINNILSIGQQYRIKKSPA